MTSATSVQRTVALDRGNLLRIYDGEGMRLTPASGVLWITEEQSANDTVLLPGDTHQLEMPGLALVHAHRAARVVMELPIGRAAPYRVDLALASGARGNLFAFPTRGLAFFERWTRRIAVAIRKAFVGMVGDRSNRIQHTRDGSSRGNPFPYY
jgi:DUF2917 family protein